MIEQPIQLWQAPALPVGVWFVKRDDGLEERRTYTVHLPGTGTVGTVTAWGRANATYRARNGRTYSGGSHVEWSWESMCGHLSSRVPDRRFYPTRRVAAQLLLAEVARHRCSEVG